MSEERDQEQYAAYLAEQDAHEEALAQRAAEEDFEQCLAAAHRAGAIEANQAIIDELTQAGLEYGRISKWMTDEDRLDAKISRSVISEMLRRIERIKARYVEPEEEKKG